MRKIYCLLILILFISGLSNSFAQAKDTRLFALRPNGFRALPDTSKGYVVLEIPNVGKDELYKRALREVNKLYNNPKFVTSAIPGESIVIHATQSDVFRGLMNSSYLVDYSFEIAFKDGKLKIEPNGIHIENLKGDVLYLLDPGGLFRRYIFKENGELKLDNAKYDLDNFFNGVLHKIIDGTREGAKEEW